MGPSWWGAVMGTGIIGTLTFTHVGSSSAGIFFARFFLLAGWLLMLGFAAGFLYRVVRNPEVFRASISGVASTPWGMVSMGILSVGSATVTVAPGWIGNGHPLLTEIIWDTGAILWTIGTIIGLLTTFGFTITIIRNRPKSPRPAWGLAVVPPMVTATTGTAFIPLMEHASSAMLMIVFLCGCFAASLLLGFCIFSTAYDYHWRINPIPVEVSATSWIPLGVVGQSTAAAGVISINLKPLVVPEATPAIHNLANGYGFAMLGLGVPLVLVAIMVTACGFRSKMTFSPTWWAMTFPVGTLSLGSHYLSLNTGFDWLNWVSIGIWIALLGTWTFCAFSTSRVAAQLLAR